MMTKLNILTRRLADSIQYYHLLGPDRGYWTTLAYPEGGTYYFHKEEELNRLVPLSGVCYLLSVCPESYGRYSFRFIFNHNRIKLELYDLSNDRPVLGLCCLPKTSFPYKPFGITSSSTTLSEHTEITPRLAKKLKLSEFHDESYYPDFLRNQAHQFVSAFDVFNGVVSNG